MAFSQSVRQVVFVGNGMKRIAFLNTFITTSSLVPGLVTPYSEGGSQTKTSDGQMAPTRKLSWTILVLAIVKLAGDSPVKGLDLPVATHGTEQWVGVVGQALMNGGTNQEKIMQALTKFRSRGMASLQEKAHAWTDVLNGNFTALIEKLLTPKLSISAPVFFNNGAGLITSSAKGVDISFKGINYNPCAVVINPTAVSVGATGINLSPQGISVAPTGVNVNPFGASISPSLIVIAPYDTTVAGQGLNIAPALIAIAPVKTVVNPVGPLSIGGSLVSATVPALP